MIDTSWIRLIETSEEELRHFAVLKFVASREEFDWASLLTCPDVGADVFAHRIATSYAQNKYATNWRRADVNVGALAIASKVFPPTATKD